MKQVQKLTDPDPEHCFPICVSMSYKNYILRGYANMTVVVLFTLIQLML
jgi:hypothetical protein